MHYFPTMLEILPVLISLIIVEVLLSIDNALVNAALADQFAKKDRKRLIRLGIVLEIIFRIITLVLMAVIIQNIWLKFICGLYLLMISIKHIGRPVDREGHLIRRIDTTKVALFQIAVADRVFSINNVFAIATFSTKFEVVLFAVVLSMVVVAVAAPLLAKFIKRYKGMSQATFTLVGLLGVVMCIEAISGSYISNLTKTLVVVVVLLFTILFEHSHKTRNFFLPALHRIQYVVSLPLELVYSVIRKVKRGFSSFLSS